jgi:hypothetical protein
MKNTGIAAALFILLFMSSGVWGQATLSETEKQDYFNDKRISASKNTVKTDLVGFIQKELSVYLEHKYAQMLSIEVALGYLFPGYQHSVYSTLFAESDSQYYGSGFSTYLQQRFYTSSGFKPYYIQFNVKHRQFSTMSSGDLMLGFGQQWLLGDRFWFDMCLGMGLRKKWRRPNDPYGYQDFDDFMLSIPVSLKLGYILI